MGGKKWGTGGSHVSDEMSDMLLKGNHFCTCHVVDAKMIKFKGVTTGERSIRHKSYSCRPEKTAPSADVALPQRGESARYRV